MGDVVWNETEGQVQDRLRAQVARLEGELEKWKSAYQREVRAVEKVARERDEAQAAIRAKDAALLGIERGEGAFYGVFSRRPSARAVNTIENMKGIARAALSPDAGKGWLPPEVGEQVRAALVLARRRLHPRSASYIVAEVDKAIAALDALKGVE